jgi:transcriptional accessory protein Tex/SPT6
MAVDLDAIARRGRCEVSSLKIALPLLEQGYQPPFLARYRRDELGGLDEATLWSLKAAVDAEQSIADFREQLHETWKTTPLADPAIGEAIHKSGSKRTLQRLSKRLRQETASGVDTGTNRLSVRMLNPKKGDPSDLVDLAKLVDGIDDPVAAADGLEEALPKRLAGDPRVISAAVRWLSRNAKIHISNVHDPHTAASNQDSGDESGKPDTEKSGTEKPVAETPAAKADENSDAASAPATDTASEKPTEQASNEQASNEQVSTGTAEESDAAASNSTPPAPASSQQPGTPAEPPAQPSGSDSTESASAAENAAGNTSEENAADSSANASTDSDESLPGFAPDPEADAAKAKKSEPKPAKKSKKISPRQRRRRWLVSVLKPLEGKRLPATKLSAFQVVMLGRALRSQVAVCAFEYDAAKLVAEIKKTVVGLNRSIESVLGDVVMQHEADIREAAEAAWWDELHERASTRLVGVTADHLRKQVNRGPIEAQVVMSIDAVGPKTAATAIVSSDGRVLLGEDLPCQLSANVRPQTVARMGELIHQYNVDLVVISNGPARRACLIALSDLISQSPENSIRWTVADRTGADAYSSSDVANSEMRSTPRRFRGAAWLAFSILHPAQAYAKVDPLRLRLSSFQSELSDDALAITLGHIMASGASRGGVDANAAPKTWLQQLPGMTAEVAEALVQRREQSLLKSRAELLSLDGWKSAVESRQALPFLRVFQSEEVLDGTLIHPDDYPLAKKLASSLEIELPPPAPPEYEAPQYAKTAAADAEPKLVDATPEKAPAPVEDFDKAGEKAKEFSLPAGESSADTGDGEAAEGNAAAGNSADGNAADENSADKPATEPTSESSEVSQEDATGSDTSSSEASTGDGEQKAGEADSAEPPQAAKSEAGPESSPPPPPVRRPKPEQAKIDKCIKEWQVGKHRVNQLVNWLCDPFGETAISDDPPGVLATMPTLKTLKPGDQVVGVVVGVMSFGVFVELAPDCSGLIHVSRLSDGFVEDLNEAIQVGDVVTAWVTGIDEKRRRVGLSALSPEQEAAIAQERESGGRGRGGRSGGPRGKGGGRGRGGAPQSRGGQGQAGGSRGQATGQAAGRDGQGRSGQGRGGQGRGGQGRGGQGRGGQGRGGRGRDQRGGRKSRQPESYRVVAKPEQKPISDAMQKGDEPLRSFGDLLQFYSEKEKDVPEKKSGGGQKAENVNAAATPSDVSSESQSKAASQMAEAGNSADTKPSPAQDASAATEGPASAPSADSPAGDSASTGDAGQGDVKGGGE